MLKQRFILDFGSKFFLYFINAVVGLVVSRVVGPEVVGTVAFGISYVSIFFFLFGLFGPSHIKAISEGKNKEDCIRVYSIMILVTFVLFFVLVFGNFFLQKFYFGKEYSQTEEVVIYISAFIIGVQGLYKIPEISFVASLKQVKVNIPPIINGIISNIGRLLVIFLGYKAIALASVKLFTAVLLIPVYFKLMNKDFFTGKWNWDIFKKYIKVGVPVFVITSTLALTDHYSKVMLTDSSSVKELGYFSGGASIAGMLMMLGATAGALFFPLFSKAYSENKLQFISDKIRSFERFLFLFILPVIATLGVFSGTVIPLLLGDKYLPSIPIFSTLVSVSFFAIWALPYYNLINGMGRFNFNAKVNFVLTVGFFILLYYVLDKKYLNYGGLGLAICLLVLNIVKVIVLSYYARIKLKTNFDTKLIKILIFYTILISASYYVYVMYIQKFDIWIRVLFSILFFILMYVIPYFFKILKKDDLTFLFDTLNIKSLVNYTKEELKEKD